MRQCWPALIALLFWFLPALAQNTCPLPPAIEAIPRGADIFSDQQEVDLGDAMAEQIGQHTNIIENDSLTAYLRTIGSRLVQHLPPNHLNFRFYLIELPEVNAFSIAGGRVYVARKMVAVAESEDELAGVLAHELGHIITHQSAIFATQRFREVLGVTRVGDRADVFDKFHLYVQNAARKPAHGDNANEERQQVVADQVALYAMARAGYAPHAYLDLWDRFQQTHGKTGSWLSDLLGSTKPSERRLREMLKNFSQLSGDCADIRPVTASGEFAKWRATVVSYSGPSHTESLPGLVLKQKLALRLRPDLSFVHFSPDGKHILAQDEGGIHVIRRDPFAVVFYIPAIDAYDASFTPDSQSIVFYTRSLRVETWSIPQQKRTSVDEVTTPLHCIQTSLSSDGTSLACLDYEFTLSLLDVKSGSTLLTKKSFYVPRLFDFLRFFAALREPGSVQLIAMGFSPDNHYFLAGSRSGHASFDLTSRREAPLAGSIKAILEHSFAFVGNDRIVGVELTSQAKSPVLRFPSGERVEQVPLSASVYLHPVSRGDYVIIGPLTGYSVGIMDLKTKTIPAAVKERVLDIYDDTLIRERINGEISLESLSSQRTLERLRLPEARLGKLRAGAASPDLNYLAVSTGTRAAVWDVVHNVRVQHVRGFQEAWFGDDGAFYVDMAKFNDVPRQIVRLDTRGGGQGRYQIGDSLAEQRGPYLILTISKRSEPTWSIRNVDVEIRDLRDGHLVGSHHYSHEVPAFTFSGNQMLLSWALSQPGGHQELERFPNVKAKAERDDYLCEVTPPGLDSVSASVLVKTNKRSFAPERAVLAGDWLVVSGSKNEVLTYSVSTGEEKGHFFGHLAIPGPVGGLLAMENESGQLSLYDLASSQLHRQYMFSDPISFKQFSSDGKRLLVLTADQTVYILDLTVTNSRGPTQEPLSKLSKNTGSAPAHY